MSLVELTKSWQTFYAMLGGATATLLGLLFVALALNKNKIHRQENAHFLRLSRLTFSNYLMLFVLAMQMLVPTYWYFQVRMSLGLIATIGFSWTLMLRNKGLDANDPNASFFRTSVRQSFISYIVIIILLAIPERQAAMMFYFLITPVTLLAISSIRNSWGLLMMLRDEE